MKRTLVIHPQDPSTDFLTPIYADKGFDVLKSSEAPITKELLAPYQRMIMMGHGNPYGLFSLGKFPSEFAIGDQHAELLRDKECVYIWCHASVWVTRNHLRGFSSGMFISEVSEAAWFGLKVSQEEIDASNSLFANVMREYLDTPVTAHSMYQNQACPIVTYNRSQFCLFDGSWTPGINQYGEVYAL